MAYLLKRLSQMIAILALLSVALFGLLSLMPGNPVDLLITSNPNIRPEDVYRLKKLRGLDQPWFVQYYRWIWGYYDPLKPPEISAIAAIKPSSKQKSVFVDVSPYVVDPNYFPDFDLAKKWLVELWPSIKNEDIYLELIDALAKQESSRFLQILGRNDYEIQKAFLEKTHKESVKNITIEGLFNTHASGTILTKDLNSHDDSLWFVARNLSGQEKLGQIPIAHKNSLGKIDSQVVQDENKPFTLNLGDKFSDDLSFQVVEGSPGKVQNNVYQHFFSGNGQTVVQLTAMDKKGHKFNTAFDVEYGILENHKKFNYGFLFVFLGKRESLGFSHTYKRPVYDLLFGTAIACGNGRLEPGEMCDDNNNSKGDGCSNTCMLESASFIEKADTSIAGSIVRSGRVGNTIQLMLPAILLSLIIAIPLGAFSAYRQYSILDYIINFLAFVGISLPVFWFGIMMIYLFSEKLHLFPAGGVQTPGIYSQGAVSVFLDRLNYAILPTMVLSIFYVGRWLRYMRASMLEVLPKDFIRTARAKGLSEKTVIIKHAFRNALIPVVTILALSIPSLFGGAVLTETVFSWPGVGRLQYDAVMNSDYYVAIVVFLVAAVLVMLGNFLADLVYILVDPRMRKG